jgi:hypothetical protein
VALKPARTERLTIQQGELRRTYGRFLTAVGRFGEAEAQLVQSLELLRSVYAREDHPNIAETRRALMELYEVSNQPALVDRYRVPPGEYVPY